MLNSGLLVIGEARGAAGEDEDEMWGSGPENREMDGEVWKSGETKETKAILLMISLNSLAISRTDVIHRARKLGARNQ